MGFPKDILSEYIFAPAYRFYRDNLSASARHNKIYKPIANFIYDKSSDMPVIMLAFNAISILSSHLAQIGGLRRSNRENKDYLITQEVGELILDSFFTILPPFILNAFLTKKLDSGNWATESSRNNLRYVIAPTVGAQQKELYNTDHIVGMKQRFSNAKNSVLLSVKKSTKLPKSITSKINVLENQAGSCVPAPKMDKILTDFDKIRKRKFNGFYNGSAYDEIMGQRNGILMSSAILYTIVASCIITPIFKNLLSNYISKKQLEKTGETKESLARKKRYNSLANTAEIDMQENVFNVFSNSNNTTTSEKVVDRSLYQNLLRASVDEKNVFTQLNSFKGIPSQTTGLRI